MRISLRTWLDEHPVTQETRSLFEESFKCFAVEAYRASLLFSYLGLLRAVADRILLSECPVDYPEGKWKKHQSQVRDEAGWEQATAQILQDTQPRSIFLIDDDLCRQLVFWRDRRNDAAHWRGTEITHSHVEALWSFVRSQLPKIVIDGSSRALLLKFQRHFDPTHAPPGKDIEPLLQEIHSAVRPADHQAFVSELAEVLQAMTDHYSPIDPLDSFVSKLLDLNYTQLISALGDYLTDKPRLLVHLVSTHPRLLLCFADNPTLIRRLWREHLQFGEYGAFTSSWDVEQNLKLVLRLLEQRLIPVDEQEEAILHMLTALDGGEMISTPTDETLDRLEHYGFFDAMEQHGFGVPNLEWLGRNVGLVCEYLRRRPPTAQVAYAMARLYNSHELGPEELSVLAHYFDDDADRFQEVLSLAQASHTDTARLSCARTPDKLFEPFSG